MHSRTGAVRRQRRWRPSDDAGCSTRPTVLIVQALAPLGQPGARVGLDAAVDGSCYLIDLKRANAELFGGMA